MLQLLISSTLLLLLVVLSLISLSCCSASNATTSTSTTTDTPTTLSTTIVGSNTTAPATTSNMTEANETTSSTTTTTTMEETTTTTSTQMTTNTSTTTTTAAPPPPTTTTSSSNNDNNTSTTTTTASQQNTSTTTTTLLPPWTSLPPGSTDHLAPIEYKFVFKPKVSPDTPENVLTITKEILTFRQGMRALFELDLANFLNIGDNQITMGEFFGKTDGTFSVSVIFKKPTNYTAYQERLSYYASETNAVPDGAFPRMAQVVKDSAAPGIDVLGLQMVSAEPFVEDNFDALCFIGQDNCLGAYMIILCGALVVIGGGFLMIRKKFDTWKKQGDNPQERQFNQEGLNRHDLSAIDNNGGAGGDPREMSLMQQYADQEAAREQMRMAQMRASRGMPPGPHDDML